MKKRRKVTKRLAALFLSLVLAVTYIPAVAFAEDSGESGTPAEVTEEMLQQAEEKMNAARAAMEEAEAAANQTQADLENAQAQADQAAAELEVGRCDICADDMRSARVGHGDHVLQLVDGGVELKVFDNFI